MAAIAVQDVTAAGLAGVTLSAANGGGDTVAGGTKSYGGYEQSSTLLVVRNADASGKTVTVGALDPVTVAAGAFALIPVPNEGLGDASVAVTYSAVTSVTVGAVRVLP